MIVAKLQRISMCSQEAGFDRNMRILLLEATDNPQHFQLSICREPVATFYFKSASSKGYQFFQSFTSQCKQLFLAGSSESGSRVEGTPTPCSYFCIAEAFDTIYKLLFTAGSKYQMGMRVNPRG